MRQTDREIARLAIPALATLLAEPLYVLTDTAVVGHLGTPQLGGLALASTVLLTGYSIFIFLAYGTTASVARLLGAGDREEAARQAVQSMWLAATIGFGLTVLGLGFGRQALGLLGSGEEVLAYGWTYLWISLLGVPALMLTLAGTGYLRGLQNTRVPLFVTFAGVAANLIIEVALIFGLGFGIGASAFASIIAQWGVAGIYLAIVLRHARSLGAGLRPVPRMISTQLGVGSDLLVRTVALRSSLVVATAVAARMGTVTLAAHQIAFEIWNFLAMALDAIAIAAQALIGRMLGAGDAAEARNSARRMLQWGLAAGFAGLVVVALTSHVLPRIFSADAEVVALAATLLLWVAVLQPVNAVAFVLDGVIIG
ncbi:MAG TPA: MATE family efflux transporter, partial [Microthrixaceae bacterium]|nr:MATE family efflux transporter [Microthrixaceae bacterium]